MSSSGMGMMIGSLAMGVWEGPSAAYPGRHRLPRAVRCQPARGVPAAPRRAAGGRLLLPLLRPRGVSAAPRPSGRPRCPRTCRAASSPCGGWWPWCRRPWPRSSRAPGGPVLRAVMAPGGALAGTVGRVMGTGSGRGIALLLVVLGAVILVNAVTAWLSPAMRNVEEVLARHAPGALGPACRVAPSNPVRGHVPVSAPASRMPRWMLRRCCPHPHNPRIALHASRSVRCSNRTLPDRLWR